MEMQYCAKFFVLKKFKINLNKYKSPKRGRKTNRLIL